MKKEKLSEKELLQVQEWQLLHVDFHAQKSGDLLNDMRDVLLGIFHYNEGLSTEAAQDLEAREHSIEPVEGNKTPYGRYLLNQAGCRYFGLFPQEVEYAGTDFVQRYIHPDMALALPQITQLYLNRDEQKVISYFHRVRARENAPYEWMYSSTKFYAPQNTMIVLSTPIRQLDGIGHKMNRILDEDAYMKANWAKFNSLGTREKEVLTLLAQGLSNPQIAEALFISRSTVEQHRKNIYRKLELDNLAQLIKFALAFDLI